MTFSKLIERRVGLSERLGVVRNAKESMLERAMSVAPPPIPVVSAALFGICHCDGADAIRSAVAGDKVRSQTLMGHSLSAGAWAVILCAESLRQLYAKNSKISMGAELTDAAMIAAGIACVSQDNELREPTLLALQSIARFLGRGVKSWTDNPVFNFVLWMLDPSMRSRVDALVLSGYEDVVRAWENGSSSEFGDAIRVALLSHLNYCNFDEESPAHFAYPPFDVMPLEVLLAIRLREREGRSGSIGDPQELELAISALPVGGLIEQSPTVRSVRGALEAMASPQWQ